MAIEAGGRYTLVLFTNGEVKRWGATGARLPYSLDYINLGTDRTATAITIGSIHFCIILQDGELKCGENIDPTFVSLATSRSKIAVDMGTFHSCAIIDNGDVKCWGPLSEGSEDDLPNIDLGTNRTATSITLGQYHTCAVLDNGEVKCWGSNAYGQLGQTTASYCNRYYCPNMGDALPAVDLGTGRTATSIAAGEHHTCAILDSGDLKCWGRNNKGQLGLGDTGNHFDMGDALPAVNLGTDRTATAIDAGSCLAVNADPTPFTLAYMDQPPPTGPKFCSPVFPSCCGQAAFDWNTSNPAAPIKNGDVDVISVITDCGFFDAFLGVTVTVSSSVNLPTDACHEKFVSIPIEVILTVSAEACSAIGADPNPFNLGFQDQVASDWNISNPNAPIKNGDVEVLSVKTDCGSSRSHRSLLQPSYRVTTSSSINLPTGTCTTRHLSDY
eukprot:gene11629-34338_t